jgi:hypothetical protein
MSNTVLYALWGALYALCAGLGFIAAPGVGLVLLMRLLSLALFVPPLILNHRAAKAEDRQTLTLVRNLSGLWLLLTSILLVGNFLTVLSSETVGNILYYLLTIVCSPLVAGHSWALTIFLWAYVLFDSLAKLKRK